MFLSIEVTDFHNFQPEPICSDDVKKYKAKENKALDDLASYLIVGSNTLDGDEIQNHLFPEKDVDVFLSHSHADEDEVIKLAIMLERQGLSVFIDSCVWGNAFDLLKVIDDEYCYNTTTGNYGYIQRNYSTSHAYMMLNTALHRMIDSCEVFLFLGTPNSVSINESIGSTEVEDSVKSPWILSELALIQHIRRKSAFKDRLKSLTENLEIGLESYELVMDSVSFSYSKPKLDHQISGRYLTSFLRQNNQGKMGLFKNLYQHLDERKPHFRR